jgi:hypothetical protein
MKSFKSYLSSQSDAIKLKEGGNAVDQVVRINQENVEATLQKIYKTLFPKLKLSVKDSGLLGSTGKKKPGGSSGDIDLAVSIKALVKNNKDVYTIGEVFDHIASISKKSNIDFKDMRSVGVISLGFPIENVDGKQPDAYVQLDFMPTEDVEYAKWQYYSPAEWESELKGVYRNYVLFAIAKHIDFKVIQQAQDKSGKMVDVTWERHFIDMSKGLMKGTQTRMSKAGNIVKTLKTLTKKEITKDPDEVIKLLFGPKWKAKDILTFDQAIDAMFSPQFIHKKNLPVMSKMLVDSLVKSGYPIPKILAKKMGL